MGGVAGYVEQNETPYEAALKEIREEAGLDSSEVIFGMAGDSVSVVDVYEGKYYDWVIYPFVFEVKDKEKIRFDWEHTECRWIEPKDIVQYETVPGLKEIVKQLVK